MKEQHILLNEFRGKDNWLLIVLDACRYDHFEDIVSIEKRTIQEAWSRGHRSIEWLQKEWESYNECKYITTNPHIETADIDNYIYIKGPKDTIFEGKNSMSSGGSTFNKITKIEEISPKHITKQVVNAKEEEKRIVGHYMSPHRPYKDNPRVQGGNMQNIDKKTSAYREELRRVIREIKTLIDTFNRPMAITADHGEALGEDGNFGHGTDMDILHRVPWVELKPKDDSSIISIKTTGFKED